MASRQAHVATGWAAGVIAAALVAHAGMVGPFHVWCVCAFIAGISGGTAPDWLEVAWWSRRRRLWIKHRTLTHWGVAWIALVMGSYWAMPCYPYAAVPFGFAVGGLMHLVCDTPNPYGVPWLLHRVSLNWWKSGRCDLFVVTFAWAAAVAAADMVWFRSVHVRAAIVLMQSWHPFA
ncbi:metal-dependent hydrolase [Noviherbaspirillum pedocola]|uniref:Metal-dependent hydrolase n=1 Tax=Noviherbaspirillum pedocola TaxID=2801341 RepID=A0A934SZZ0_9BURK|nr:metal-dependent hydrolase [Noviherbaspirillum pedocola]MBK4736172.1 metal-dependent hydrolase [Noviherbaspirillum pedocola]